MGTHTQDLKPVPWYEGYMAAARSLNRTWANGYTYSTPGYAAFNEGFHTYFVDMTAPPQSPTHKV